MLAALCEGDTEILNAGGGEDNYATAAALRQLGVAVRHAEATIWVIRGVGLHGLKNPAEPIDCANSGTTARLLSGILAGAGVEATLIGDPSLSRRPMARVAAPLTDLGYRIETSEGGRLPLRVMAECDRERVNAPVRAVLRTASAQVKSAILLAGLFRAGVTEVVEPEVTRDHSERLLRALGVRVSSSPHYARPAEGARLDTAPSCRLVAPQVMRGTSIAVPGDISSAAFLWVAGMLTGGGITVEGVGLNPTRTGVLHVFEAMGARARSSRRAVLSSGEPAGDLLVTADRLRGATIEGPQIPLLIDEIPILAVLAAVAEGTTHFRDAAELRVKESDRIATVATLLRALGREVEERQDGFSVAGTAAANWPGFEIDSAGDHRIAIAGVVAALAASSPSCIRDAGAIDVSYPSLVDDLRRLGARLEWSDT
jgi:3-phosphoshikimate 1-carboxyvinyltransferase